MSIYVMSDLHGCFHLYNKMLEKIKFSDSDELYILGDVVDRGKESMPLLLDIMRRQNVYLLLGNHDDRLLEVATDCPGLTAENLQQYAEHCLPLKYWLYESPHTAEEFLSLSEDVQVEIRKYLEGLPLFNIIAVGNLRFFLSHMLPNRERLYEIIKSSSDLSSLKHNRSFTNDFTLGDIEYNRKYSSHDDILFLTGHTPTYLKEEDGDSLRGRIYRNKQNHIDVDTGCEYTGILGCLRLDDMKEYYVSQWAEMTMDEILFDLFGLKNVDRDIPISKALGINPEKYKKYRLENFYFTRRTYVCMAQALGPDGYNAEVSKILEMSINRLTSVRKLGRNGVVEVLSCFSRKYCV